MGNGSSFKIYVGIYNGKAVSVDTWSGSTVLELLQALASYDNGEYVGGFEVRDANDMIPFLTLYHKGKALDNSKTLGDYGIEEGARLKLSLKARSPLSRKPASPGSRTAQGSIFDGLVGEGARHGSEQGTREAPAQGEGGGGGGGEEEGGGRDSDSRGGTEVGTETGTERDDGYAMPSKRVFIDATATDSESVRAEAIAAARQRGGGLIRITRMLSEKSRSSPRMASHISFSDSESPSSSSEGLSSGSEDNGPPSSSSSSTTPITATSSSSSSTTTARPAVKGVASAGGEGAAAASMASFGGGHQSPPRGEPGKTALDLSRSDLSSSNQSLGWSGSGSSPRRKLSNGHHHLPPRSPFAPPHKQLDPPDLVRAAPLRRPSLDSASSSSSLGSSGVRGGPVMSLETTQEVESPPPQRALGLSDSHVAATTAKTTTTTTTFTDSNSNKNGGDL